MDERELSLEVGRTLKTLLQKLWKAGNAIMRVRQKRMRWIQEAISRKTELVGEV